jgi:hypothetical protein
MTPPRPETSAALCEDGPVPARISAMARRTGGGEGAYRPAIR